MIEIEPALSDLDLGTVNNVLGRSRACRNREGYGKGKRSKTEGQRGGGHDRDILRLNEFKAKITEAKVECASA